MTTSTNIQAIFFDWGGVIADDPGDDFLGSLLRQIGATDSQVEEIFDTYMFRFMKGELSETEYWSNLQAHYGLAVHDTISEEFKKWKGLSTNDKVFSLVGKARSKGIRTAALSNIIEPTYNVLASAGYFKAFDTVIASCKVGSAKPEKEIYEIALRELNVTAEASLFIDDKPRNIEPAAAMGFRTILAKNPQQIIDDVMAYIQ